MRPAKNHRPVLLKTAARLFAQKPFHEVLMEDVATEAGVAKGTIYRFFSTKEKLYAAVCLESLDEMNGQLGEAAQAPELPLVRLERMAGIVVEYFRAHRDFFQILQREWVSAQQNGRAAFLARRSAARDLFASVIREGQETGAFNSFSADLAADGLLGIIRSFVRFGDPKLAPRELTDQLLELFLHGIAAIERREKEPPCPTP
jgi:AcrR family transcriptional regulator